VSTRSRVSGGGNASTSAQGLASNTRATNCAREIRITQRDMEQTHQLNCM